MYYGLYLSASGVLANTHRQDVFANNLANVETAGFKPMLADVRQRPAESVEDRLPFRDRQPLLDRLGGGVLVEPRGAAFSAAAVNETGRPLDAALLEGDTFFSVEVGLGQGRTQTRVTRNGQFVTDAQGFLRTSNGHRVLGEDDRPIQLDTGAGRIEIDARGWLRQNGEDVVQLGVSRIDQPGGQLRPAGDNTFAFLADDPRLPADDFGLAPKSLEASGADPIATLMQVVSSSKSAMGNATMMRYQDAMIDRAVNTLGKVS
ncbi:MAG: flagellar hook basal-body protein [Planctomycetota bacterium]